MKKHITLIVIALIPFASRSLAQGKFDLYVEAAPQYSYRTTSENGYYGEDEPMVKHSESIKLGYNITTRFQVISGIELNNKGYKYASLSPDLYSIIQPVSEYCYCIDNTTKKATKKATLSYVEIPLYFKYSFKIGKAFISPVIGLSYGKLLTVSVKDGDKKYRVNYPDLANPETDFLGSFNMNEINQHVGLEFKYPLSGTLSVAFEPKFDFTYTAAMKNITYTKHNYIIGTNIGLVKNF